MDEKFQTPTKLDNILIVYIVVLKIWNPLFQKQCMTLRFVINNGFVEENVNLWL